jgi:hypothetical protein
MLQILTLEASTDLAVNDVLLKVLHVATHEFRLAS